MPHAFGTATPRSPRTSPRGDASPPRPALRGIDLNVSAGPGVGNKCPRLPRASSTKSLAASSDRDTAGEEARLLAEDQARLLTEQADEAVDAFRESLNVNGKVDLQGFLAKLLADTEKVRQLFRNAPTAKKLMPSPANISKLNASNKDFKVHLKEIMQQQRALSDAAVKVEDCTNGRIQAQQEETARQQQEHAEAQLLLVQAAQASQDVFDQKLAEAAREHMELSAAADRREAELTRMLEGREKDIIQAQSAAEQLRREFAALQLDLEGCRASLQAKAALAEETTREKDLLQARFDTLREQHGHSENQQMQAIAELKVMVGNLTTEVETQKLEVQTKASKEADQQTQILALHKRLLDEERQRRDMHNAIQEMKGNIRVVGRSRPAFEEDADMALRVSEGTGKMAVAHGGETYNFELGNVFAGTSSQERIYEEVSGLVQSALDGYNVCIFAYGQTGSGKTFTMQGSHGASGEGIIPRALNQIFESTEAMREKGWTWTLEASFLEVYQEAIRDLLIEGAAAESQLAHMILHDEVRGPTVSNLTVVHVDSVVQIRRLMAKAAKHRSVGQTDMNAVSSRSHAIFTLSLKGVNAELDTELAGALHLVDLAGSERLGKSHATGTRMKETCSINRSLSCLTDVFAAKREEARGERTHIPFRNSKLTHLMEPCLSGNGKTLMVVNLAPEDSHAHETLCSLRFASHVAQCNTGGQPKRNAKTLGDTAPRPAPPKQRPATPTSRPATPTKRAGSGAVAPAAAQAGMGRPTVPFGM